MKYHEHKPEPEEPPRPYSDETTDKALVKILLVIVLLLLVGSGFALLVGWRP